MVFEIKNRHIVGMFVLAAIILTIGIVHGKHTYNKTMKILQYGEKKSEVIEIDLADNNKQVWNFEINIDYYKDFNRDRFILLLTRYIKKLQYSIRDNEGYLESDLEGYFASKMANIGSVSIESLECYNDLFVEALSYNGE